MIRVIALDLDDTLLRSDKTISPESLALLRRWRAQGHHLVIATGRPPRAVAEVLPRELFNVPWVCYNGAAIQIDGRTIFQDLIPPEDARAIVEMIQARLPDCTVGLEVDNILYLNRAIQRTSPYQVADLRRICQRPAAKVLFFQDAQFQEATADLRPLLQALPASTRALLSEKYNLVQILSHSADKARALEMVVRQWGLGLEHVMAFGDDVNDVEMVRRAGLGVAVADAVAEVKAVADHITASNDEDGVALALEALLSGRLGPGLG